MKFYKEIIKRYMNKQEEATNILQKINKVGKGKDGKLRILYCQLHPTLDDIQIPLFIKAGFEAMRPMSHILMPNPWYSVSTMRDMDSIDNVTNVMCKNSCSLDDETFNRIRIIDIFNIKSNQPLFTSANREIHPDIYTPLNISDYEISLINENIDVIFIFTHTNLAIKILPWFDGIVSSYLYGTDISDDFSIYHHWKGSLYSDELMRYKDRYISALFFSIIQKKEHKDIMGSNRVILFGDIAGQIKQKMIKFGKWNDINNQKQVVTSITYIHRHPISQNSYNDFIKYFGDLNYRIYGKNSKCELTDKDKNISLEVESKEEYYNNLKLGRVFVYAGQCIQHNRYTPFEAIAMGVPTLFLRNTGFGNEGVRSIGSEAMKKAGMCETWQEMRDRAEKCLEDIQYAKNLAKENQIIIDKVFSDEVCQKQTDNFYQKCLELHLNRKKLINQYCELYEEREESKKYRILWCHWHDSHRKDELPRFWQAGFEVVPIKMPKSLMQYEGSDYDDENKKDHPKWRENCSLPREIVDRIRSIQVVCGQSPFLPDSLNKDDIDVLNKFIGVIYCVSSVTVALNLLQMGYKGIILFRHLGHYKPGLNGANHLSLLNDQELLDDQVNMLARYPNVRYCAGLHSLPYFEDQRISRKDNQSYIGYLARKKEGFIKFKWQAEKSDRTAGMSLSMLSTGLFHYYENWIKHFGHLPYLIYGKNKKEEMEQAGIEDEYVVGQLEKFEDLYNGLSKLRVYIEPGFIPHHCHYTPMEAVLMEIPMLFHHTSGFAEEAFKKWSASELLEMGMCSSWEQMAVIAEKCLRDIEFAKELSRKQRPLEKIVTEEEIVQEMIEFKKSIPEILKNCDELYEKNKIIFNNLLKKKHRYKNKSNLKNVIEFIKLDLFLVIKIFSLVFTIIKETKNNKKSYKSKGPGTILICNKIIKKIITTNNYTILRHMKLFLKKINSRIN
jgi:hypothetical protein